MPVLEVIGYLRDFKVSAALKNIDINTKEKTLLLSLVMAMEW